jgi:hypothetical protein
MILGTLLNLNMRQFITYRSLLLLGVLLLLRTGTLEAARGMLHLDGILSVRGDRSSSARVIILPTGGMPTSMENVSGAFKLSLPLDGTYLLSFEREGLVTKQVYFDTTVPVERHTETMSFPFKVTLFPEGKDNVYAYAGPVGIVRYYVSENDFSYITDYTLKEGAPMSKRIMELQKRMEVRGADGLPMDRTEVVYTAVRVEGSVAPAPKGVGTSSTEPAVAVALPTTTVDDVERPSLYGSTLNEPLEDPGISEHSRSEADVLAKETMATSDELLKNASLHPRPEAPKVRRRTPTHKEQVHSSPGEELIIERQRVITVIRLAESTGHVTEYRRVVDRHGAIVHFRDGVAIPEYVYREATGR